MQNDTRFRNKNFSMESIGHYLDEYSKSTWIALKEVDCSQLEIAANVIKNARAWGLRIFVAGNGGSSAIAEHLDCDFTKGTHFKDRSNLEVISLVSNTAVMTAIANDISYEEIFSKRLEFANAREGEILILISSSGNSPNIVKACEFARARNMIVIGLTGFSGGKLMEQANVRLHVPFHNYGVVEDAHQSLMHVLAQWHELSLR